MFCEECGNPINDGEKFCSKCGAAVAPAPENAVGSEKNTQKTEDSKLDVAKAAEAVNKVAATTVEGAKKMASKGKETIEKLDENTGGKLSELFNSKKKIPLIIGVAALLVVILCVANGARINNFVHKVFLSPEKYYQYVEKNAIQDLISCGGEIYDSYILQSLNIYDRSAEAELTVELEEAGQDLLELAGLAGVDLSWLKSAQITGNYSVKDSTFGLGATLGINKDDIVSAKTVADVEEGNMYLQIPELTSTYMGYEAEEMLGDDELEMMTESQEMSKRLIKACPDQKKVEKLLKKYMELAIGCIDDVSKTTKTLKVEGIQQKVTELKVEIDADTLQAIMETVLEELKEDKDVEKMIISICEASDEDLDAEEAYEMFQDSIDEMLDDVDSLYIDDVTMKVYVDGKGNVRGRELEMESDYGSEISIAMLMPKKGTKIGFELSVEDSGTTLKLEGSGKESGNEISGDFNVKYNGTSIVECNVKKLDTAKLKVGKLNGTVSVKAASGISKVLGYADRDYASAITDTQLTLTSEASENSAKWNLGIIYDEEKIGTVSMAVTTGDGSKATVPSAKNTVFVEDEDDLMDWLEDIDWNKLVKKLEDTDIPSEALDVIEEIAEAMEDGDVEDVMEILYEISYY